MEETLAILAVPGAMDAIHEGRRELDGGQRRLPGSSNSVPLEGAASGADVTPAEERLRRPTGDRVVGRSGVGPGRWARYG